MNTLFNQKKAPMQRNLSARVNLLSSTIAALSMGFSSYGFALTGVTGFNPLDCGAGCDYDPDVGGSGTSARVLIDKNYSTIGFETMSVLSGNTLIFDGTSAGFSLLVRVTGGQSLIQGTIDGNLAQLVISNPNGLVFDGATVTNIGAMVATTGSINNFGIDPTQFDIENIDPNGLIHVTSNGLSVSGADSGLALVAGDIRIDGDVTVPIGDFIAKAGGEVTVSLNGGLLGVDVTQALVKSGTAIRVNSQGSIVAKSVELEAALSGDPLSLAVNHAGVIKATGVTNQGGKIRIVAANAQVLARGELDTTDGNGDRAGSVEIEAKNIILAGKTKTDALNVDIGVGSSAGRLRLLEINSLAFDVNTLNVNGLSAANAIEGLANYNISGIDIGTAGYEGIGTAQGDFSNTGAITFTNVSSLTATSRTDNSIVVGISGISTELLSGGSGNDKFFVQGDVAQLFGRDGSDTITMGTTGSIDFANGGSGAAADILVDVVNPSGGLLGPTGSSDNVLNWTNMEVVVGSVFVPTPPSTPTVVIPANVPIIAPPSINNLGSVSLGLAGTGDKLNMPCGFTAAPSVGLAAVNNDIDCADKYNSPEYQQLISSLIHFDNDSDALTFASRSRLDRVADFVLESKMFDQIVLAGHTDNNASESYNLRLSEQRVNTASSYLVDKGIDGEMMESFAFGESLPAKPNTSDDHRAYNRRVHIELKK